MLSYTGKEEKKQKRRFKGFNVGGKNGKKS